MEAVTASIEAMLKEIVEEFLTELPDGDFRDKGAIFVMMRIDSEESWVTSRQGELEVEALPTVLNRVADAMEKVQPQIDELGQDPSCGRMGFGEGEPKESFLLAIDLLEDVVEQFAPAEASFLAVAWDGRSFFYMIPDGLTPAVKDDVRRLAKEIEKTGGEA